MFYVRTTPIAVPKASISKTKGIVKLGKIRTGVVVIAFLIPSKTCCASEDQQKLFFRKRAFRGVAIEAYP